MANRVASTAILEKKFWTLEVFQWTFKNQFRKLYWKVFRPMLVKRTLFFSKTFELLCALNFFWAYPWMISTTPAAKCDRQFTSVLHHFYGTCFLEVNCPFFPTFETSAHKNIKIFQLRHTPVDTQNHVLTTLLGFFFELPMRKTKNSRIFEIYLRFLLWTSKTQFWQFY